ncbi:hypothetical protein [Muricoccus radiodurans]|uniref:hypothetical protein n=1 Tax=Muricoccus radiodurans TaxID=2231721 RepID=UPI003CEC2CA0
MRQGWWAGAPAAAILLLAGTLAAQPAARPEPPPADGLAAPNRPGWTVDARTGCWVWNPSPKPGETVTWSGACPNGPAEGEGEGEWRHVENGVPWVELYSGNLRDGRLDGRGSVASPDGTGYQGDWRNARPHGRGVALLPRGVRYEGEFRDGNRSGRGIQTWPDGTRYDGEWRNGRADGTGTFTSRTGSFSGTWFQGCFIDGQGRIVAIERRLEDCREGPGTPTSAPGGAGQTRGSNEFAL